MEYHTIPITKKDKALGWGREQSESLAASNSPLPNPLPEGEGTPEPAPTQPPALERADASLAGIDAIAQTNVSLFVFSEKWSKYIEPEKPLTQAQFEAWQKRMEIVYNSYSDLTGQRGPAKINVLLKPASGFTSSAASAHSHSGNTICFNEDYRLFKTILGDIARHNSTDMSMMHEMAHLFENNKPWSACREKMVDLLISYAMETNKELSYGSPNANPANLYLTWLGIERFRTFGN